MFLDDENYRDLYLTTININLPRYFNELKKQSSYASSDCKEDIIALIDNLQNNALIPHSILVDIEEYGKIFNTDVMDFDDIKVIIFVLNFIANISDIDCVKKACLITSLNLVKETIRQEKNFIDISNLEYGNSYSFIMIDKLIDRIKSNHDGFEPENIKYEGIIEYLGKYGLYMLCKTSYYPFQSSTKNEHEYEIFLYTVIDLLKENVSLKSNKILEALDSIRESKNFKFIEDQLYHYGTKDLKIELEKKRNNIE
jgi:hypothetical protein